MSSWQVTDTLTDWWVKRETDGYRAPELCPPYLGGKSAKRNGKNVTTSTVVEVNGRLVRTSSGSVYRLGRIHPEYRAWLRKQGIEYNAEQPIVVRK